MVKNVGVAANANGISVTPHKNTLIYLFYCKNFQIEAMPPATAGVLIEHSHRNFRLDLRNKFWSFHMVPPVQPSWLHS